jgi:hypothetical protein
VPNISLALLADYASAAETGADRVHVIGGGIRSLSFSAFPAVRQRLALALGIEFTPVEATTADHSLRIEAKGPGDRASMQPVNASFTFLPDRIQADEPVHFHFVYTMENVTFPDEGDYIYSIAVDDKHVRDVPLRILKVPGPVPRGLAASRKLTSGYEAFASGDLTKAQKAFEEVVAEFPEVPGGHNNLGFVLLGQGNADIALAAFLKARELRFPQPELLEANMACAYYLMRNANAAAVLFEQCLKAYGFAGTAILYGIHETRLFTVHLQSASDYVSLMMLNAGWTVSRRCAMLQQPTRRLLQHARMRAARISPTPSKP